MAITKKNSATFTTTLLTAKKTATGIRIPNEIIEGFGAGKKPPVKVTINGYTYQSTVAVMGGDYMVGVSADNRKGAKVEGGDKIEVTLELDTAPREVDVPEELQKALNKNAAAKTAFQSLSNSRKKVYTLSVADAKTEDTRQRRIEKAIAELSAAK